MCLAKLFLSSEIEEQKGFPTFMITENASLRGNKVPRNLLALEIKVFSYFKSEWFCFQLFFWLEIKNIRKKNYYIKIFTLSFISKLKHELL